MKIVDKNSSGKTSPTRSKIPIRKQIQGTGMKILTPK